MAAVIAEAKRTGSFKVLHISLVCDRGGLQPCHIVVAYIRRVSYGTCRVLLSHVGVDRHSGDGFSLYSYGIKMNSGGGAVLFSLFIDFLAFIFLFYRPWCL